MKVLIIDNLDSFTYNLVDEFEKRKCEVLVYQNNMDMKIMHNVIKNFKPKMIVIASGPGAPKDAGNSNEIISNYWQKIPIFGIGLGYQCIIEVFNGRIDKAHEICHGIASAIEHDNETIFNNVTNPFKAARYHSLAAVDVPYSLEISARSDKGLIMGVRHKEGFIEGVQFHPESILTPEGGKIIDNLINLVKKGK